MANSIFPFTWNFQAWIAGATVESPSWEKEATQDTTRIWRGVLSAERKVCWALKCLFSTEADIVQPHFAAKYILKSSTWMLPMESDLV